VRDQQTFPRERLTEARILLVFTPAACAGRVPLEVLEAALPSIDVIQVRPKPIGSARHAPSPCEARAAYDWTVRVLDLVRARRNGEVLVTVDDRVDVAAALASAGCAGVHLGEDDCPVDVARSVLGPGMLIGFSTHTLQQVAAAEDMPVDYLGFGPVAATATKGLSAAVGTENAWIASTAAAKPVFAIGGIDASNAGELARTGRIAVAAAILGAADPGRAAAELRRLVES
jgi:thiamine-phosphate pyrophosphorylase